jgi:cell wall-associated NlpC family hydrolase
VAAYSGLAVYNEAKRYLGVPYVFGGASFNGIDCSGLVLRAFAKFGIHLPHSAMAQAARGVRIPISQARRGDLVIIPGQHIGFWHSPGMFLEAAHPGTLVRIHSIWANYYVVRILR